jgi:hypothetical protein
VSVAAGDSDAAGDADGDGVALGSAPIALTHAKPISANKIRVAVITHHRIDESSRNGATAAAKPVGVGAALQLWIVASERSSLQTRIVMMESVSLCGPMKS